MIALLSSESPVGQLVDVTSTPEGNVATPHREGHSDVLLGKWSR